MLAHSVRKLVLAVLSLTDVLEAQLRRGSTSEEEHFVSLMIVRTKARSVISLMGHRGQLFPSLVLSNIRLFVFIYSIALLTLVPLRKAYL